MEVPGARHNLELTELDEFLDLGKKVNFSRNLLDETVRLAPSDQPISEN